MIITEDSRSGFDFFRTMAAGKGIRCLSADEAGGFLETMAGEDRDRQITIIGDGAAFGAQMGRVFPAALRRGNVQIYLPESFEWLILRSGLIDGKRIQEILEQPQEYVESTQYFSWERYFTKLLMDETRGTYLQYQKASLNPAYLQGKNMEKILAVLPPGFQRQSNWADAD